MCGTSRYPGMAASLSSALLFQQFQLCCAVSTRTSALFSVADCDVVISVCLTTATSSSPLSEPQDEDELELVSMETTDSASCRGHCGDEGLEQDGDSEEEDNDDDEEEEDEDDDDDGEGLVSLGSDELGWPWSILCNWLLLLIMLFMAFCISRSIRCFSRLGMRPNRTASLDMPTAKHFLKRHCWHRFLLILMMVQFSILRHFLY